MLWTAFIFGLLGSFHCIGMCGPIAFLLPIDHQHKAKGTVQLLVYHLGRLTTYALLGLLFGYLGKHLALFGLQQAISIAIGVLMILAIVLPKSFELLFPFKKRGYSLVAQLKSALGIQLKRKSLDMYFLVGFFNGMLPCGLVYMAIFGSIAMNATIGGATYMLFFGLGTIPLMSAAVYVRGFITPKWKRRVSRSIPYVIVLIGLLFILRGMGLGIKYISPHAAVTQPEVTTQASCH